MSQSDTVTNILERITQETAQVTTKKKIFGMKSKRTAKTPQKKVVLDSSNSSSNTSNNISPSSSPFRVQPSQLPARSQSMPAENLSCSIQDGSVMPSSSINLSENSLNESISAITSDIDFFNDHWNVISPCIDSIFEQSSGGKFEPACQAVERLCQNKQYCERINDQLLIKIDSFSEIICQKLRHPINFQSITSVLDFIQRSNVLLASIFSTFKRSYLSPQLTIDQLVFKHITKNIHTHQNIIDDICMTIVNQINEQRKETTLNINRQIDTDNDQIIHQAQLSSFQQTALAVSKLDITKDIIKPLEIKTIDFYSSLKLNDSTPQLLIKHIDLIIENEKQIVSFFTSDIQKVSISATRENVYVKRFMTDLPHLIRSIMDSKDMNSMNLISLLVSNASNEFLLKKFISSWSDDTRERCEQILSISSNMNQNERRNEEEVIHDLIQINSTMIECRKVIGDKQLQTVIRVFKNTINETTFKVAFLLAKHCHILITRDPNEFIAEVDKITNMFRYLDLMDPFFTHCKEFLAIRLLSDSSLKHSEAPKAEKIFLDKISKICGNDDAAPMYEMLKDAESWQTMNEGFVKSLENRSKVEIKEADDKKNAPIQTKTANSENEGQPQTEKVEYEAPSTATSDKLDQDETSSQQRAKEEEGKAEEELKNNPSFPVFFQTFNSTQFQQFEDYLLSDDELLQNKIDEKGSNLKFFKLPSEVISAKTKFSEFYDKISARKRLKWLPLLDRATINLNKSTIECSALYYIILDSIINGRPLKESGIEEKTAKELVDALVTNSIITCDKKDENNSIFECDFMIAPNNEDRYVYLPDPSILTPKMLKDEKIEDIFAMRQTRIEAALVLTMKNLRTAKKEDLFENIKNNVAFRVSNEDLEKCVNSLIDKSYFFTDDEGNIVFTTE